MIVNKPYGVSPILSILIDNVPVNYGAVDKVELALGESEHDLLTLTIGGLPPEALTTYYGAAVYVSIVFANHYVQEFCGYVDVVSPVSNTAAGLQNNSPFQTARLLCLGASFVMRGTTSRNWEGYSLSSIATEMASTYGFSVDTPNVPVFSSSILQNNESDWQFLVRQCKNLGYEVSVHGTHMHVYDPYDAASRGTSYHKLSTFKDLGMSPAPIPGQIIRLDGWFSRSNADGDHSSTSVSVIDDSESAYEVTTADVYGTTDSPTYRDVRTDVVDTYGEAERRIHAIRKESYDYEITVVVIGIPGCVPGGVVDIGGHGNADIEGLWYVRNVEHTVHSDAFYSELKIARNKTNVLTQTPVPSFQAPPDPTFVGGAWRTTKRVTNVY